MNKLVSLRESIQSYKHADEAEAVLELLAETKLSEDVRRRIQAQATQFVETCRGMSEQAGTLDAFLQEFGLSNKEGVALMCLAESLLRVPDGHTANALIAEKIASGDWRDHRGKSKSPFVNASVWGLMLTGKFVQLDSNITQSPQSWLASLMTTLGEPVVRNAILQAMRIMGGQYVLGRNISEAIRQGLDQNTPDTRFSFDMLGEGARTEADAATYYDAYAAAILAISPGESEIASADGISVKLSALHPRYEFQQSARIQQELLPRVRQLALLAKQRKIGFTLDAEEADRLEPSLDIIAALAADDDLAGWQGLGMVVQAYQKRAPYVIRWLARLAEKYDRNIMVRLVKGAYWDSEIKHTQEQGFADYPVYTRKCHSDLSYEVCAQILFSESKWLYPQFATHNAHTLATVLNQAGKNQTFEFQRLHGMGQLLYEQLRASGVNVPVRVYAPVGAHADLLPYLVRRLLENGANSSFVNRFLDASIDAAELMTDPAEATRANARFRHGAIPKPAALYQDAKVPWQNSKGLDLTDSASSEALLSIIGRRSLDYRASPHVNDQWVSGDGVAVFNPANPDQKIGTVLDADAEMALEAIQVTHQFQHTWNDMGFGGRMACLNQLADLMEGATAELITLIVTEAGRTLDDAISEVREAVDFCRYYAAQSEHWFSNDTELPGPAGEINRLSAGGRGVFLCISPWNFPLALFTGQVVAALVTGNTVIAKPAEQTPLVAAAAIKLFLAAGIPSQALQFLPGDGPALCKPLLLDPRLAGVAFTGGTGAAQQINRTLAERAGPIIPFIAETGGINTMIVDSTALAEQVVDDVVASAFKSAGQRCSALRVLFLQEDIADDIVQKLEGAMQEITLGDPGVLSTDVGPVIDAASLQNLRQHREALRSSHTLLGEATQPLPEQGYFFPPVVFEIDRLSQLQQEVFGPVLHVIRYGAQDIDRVIDDINSSGYGLTLGIHSRIDGFAQMIFSKCRVGNTYVNRNMVGAVVGVNPFGGHGLSGTGPKAGGPHYLHRFIGEKTFTENLVAKGGNAQLLNLDD